MAELKFYGYNHTTFGCSSASPAALRKMKARAQRKTVALKVAGGHEKTLVNVLCVNPLDVAPVMGQCAWLVLERRDFYKLEIDDDGTDYYITYPEGETKGGEK